MRRSFSLSIYLVRRHFSSTSISKIPSPIITAADKEKKFVKPNWISFVMPANNVGGSEQWEKLE
jgi:hypothetical protein